MNYKYKKININYIFLLFIFLFFVLSIDLSNNLKLGWDAQNYWLAKKLVFTNGGDIFALKSTPQNDYPYLGSFVWHIYAKFSFLGHEYFGRLFYLYIFLLSIFSLGAVVKKNFEKIILIFILIFLTYKVELLNGYQEILNFSLLVLLSKIFYEILQTKLPIEKINNKFIFLLILISSIIWIKNESSFLIIIFLLSLFLVKEINFRTKIIMLLAFGILLLIKYHVFNFIGLSNALQKGNYEYFRISNFFSFVNLPRSLLILKYIFFYSLNNIAFIISIVCLFAIAIHDKKNIFILYFLSLFFLSFCFFISAFLFSSHPLEWVLWTALDRIIFQTSGLFLILIPFCYISLKKKFSEF